MLEQSYSATDSGTPCVLLQECATICKVPLTEKALATYVHMYPTYIHNYVRMYPMYIPHHISVRCGQGRLAAVAVDGELCRHRGTFGYVGGRGRMRNFIVPGPPVAENDGVQGGGGLVLFISCFVCCLCLSPFCLSPTFLVTCM